VIVDRKIDIAAPAEETFRRALDIPFVSTCLPGAADVTEDEPGVYGGRFTVKVGPVRVALQGTVRVLEVNEHERRAALRLAGSDRGIGGNVAGTMTIEVIEGTAEQCELVVHTDVTISGKLGQFGQAVILKKTDQITREFVEAFSRSLTEQPAPAAAYCPAESPAVVTAGTSGSAPFPESVETPRVAGVHTLGALFRRGRSIVLVRGSRDVRGIGRRRDIGAAWSSNPGRLAEPRIPVVGVVSAETTERVRARARDLAARAVAAIAVLPRGAAVGDPAAAAELCRQAGAVSDLPVVLVAGTPWAALPSARVAASGVAQGIAVVPDHAVATGEADTGLEPVLAEAVAEVRRAGLELPVIAGPVARAGAKRRLLSAGADGVLVVPRRAAPRR